MKKLSIILFNTSVYLNKTIFNGISRCNLYSLREDDRQVVWDSNRNMVGVILHSQFSDMVKSENRESIQ